MILFHFTSSSYFLFFCKRFHISDVCLRVSDSISIQFKQNFKWFFVIAAVAVIWCCYCRSCYYIFDSIVIIKKNEIDRTKWEEESSKIIEIEELERCVCTTRQTKPNQTEEEKKLINTQRCCARKGIFFLPKIYTRNPKPVKGQYYFAKLLHNSTFLRV